MHSCIIANYATKLQCTYLTANTSAAPANESYPITVLCKSHRNEESSEQSKQQYVWGDRHRGAAAAASAKTGVDTHNSSRSYWPPSS